MTTDLRADLIGAMGVRLNDYYAERPTSPTPVAVPMGVFADAALEVLADGRPVPRVPAYDEETAKLRTWHGLPSKETPHLSAALHVERVADEVVVTVTGAGVVPVHLTGQDALEFALAVISAAQTGVGAGG